MVNYKTISHAVIRPCKELEGLVSHFWWSRWNTGVQNHFSYHATASISSELVFAFGPGNIQNRNAIFATAQGHTGQYNRIESGGFSEMSGVSLYSHALPFFFGISPSEFANQLVDIRELFSKDTTAVTERLARCPDFHEQVKVLTDYLLLRLSLSGYDTPVFMNAIRRMREMKGQVSIRGLADEFSLSQKQFERKFKEFSGFNPKLYSRILRFESSLASFGKQNSYTDIALDHGYYDQSHFINDFKTFSGCSPRKYRSVTFY